MSDVASDSQIVAAEGYEELLVPALFDQWPGGILDAADVRPGQHVLDVGCGTGVLARRAAERAGSGGLVVGVDPMPGMLVVAERLAPGVEWCRSTAESLPYPDGSFDAVLSQFALMFFADRERAAGEMVRTLKPGGRLAVAVWDGLDSMPAYAAEVDLLEREAGEAAADALRAPFTLADRKELCALFEDAGADAVSASTRPGSARFPSVRSMVEADLRGWLPVMGVELGEEDIRRILAQAEDALSEFVTDEGNLEFDLSAHVVTGSRPRE